MRLCVSHVYWMLLFTSVVSSALLFLIVASESIQNSKFIGPDRNQAFQEGDNVSFLEESKEESKLESDSGAQSSFKVPTPLKSKIREQSFQDIQAPISASFDIPNKNDEPKIPEEIEILKESLTQQPNLSQGISDGGPPVVLTLVDTSAASLQSLATGRTEFRAKSEGNASHDDEQQPSDGNLVRISKLLEETANGSGSVNDTGDGYFDEEDGEVVVVVRAEQKSASSIRDEIRMEKALEESESDEPAEDMPQPPTTAPELNDSAARAQLAADGAGAAAMLDTLVTAGPSSSSEPHEDMPSFNEWAQKRLEEAEKKKTHPNASVQTANGSPGRNVGNMRMRSKNYASPDCGAKIVAVNPEARSARNVLVSTRDEYMLNTCSSRIWFVVELCEAIQAKKIELANFELFSSSPKDLSVYVSDRYPTRDWTLAGHFTAKDERDVQSFALQPHLFGKFIKIDLHSHYGSEHFCPISLFRAYGTSEFEVLETETEGDGHADNRRREITAGDYVAAGSDIESEEDEDEDGVFEDEEESTSDPPGHLFGSARDAVLSIVRKAAEVLVKSQDLKVTNNITKIQESIRGDVLEDTTLDNCATPVYSVTCHDCDDDRFARVFQLISCKGHYLESLLNTDFVRETLSKSHLCSSSSGFDFLFDSEACTDARTALSNKGDDASKYYVQAQFLSSVFTPDYIIALCNVLAAREERLFANASHQEQQQQVTSESPNKTLTDKSSEVPLATKDKDRVMSTRPSEPSNSDGSKAKADTIVIKSKTEIPTETHTLSESIATQIKPTKTTSTSEEAKKPSFATTIEPSKSIQLDDDKKVHQGEMPTTTDTPVTVATKRTTATSSKTSSGSASSPENSQGSVSASEGSTQRDVPPAGTTTKTPPSKSSQSTDSSQKVAEKTTSTESMETESVKAKNEEETAAKTKVEPVEPETKPATQQDQLNLDGFDFKDFDVEGMQNNGGARNDASATQQTATPQQKESVFLRLSNRIKALERNMSLSGQYLEELSRRYKKQVEEMQRSLERAMTAMNEESRKGEERENKRLEEVNALRGQINTLTRVLDELVYERNSWRISFSSFIQHALFVLVDVVVVVLIISYCRRNDDDMYEDEEVVKNVARNVAVKPKRGKSYEIVKQSCTQLTKKPKKRRPSEIASQVSGTYDQLMIENTITSNQLSKRDKRKKRKKDSVILRTSSIKETGSRGNGNTLSTRELTLPSRSASASDALYTMKYESGDGLAHLGSQRHSRPESAPDNSISYFTEQQQQQPLYDKKVQILAMETTDHADLGLGDGHRESMPEDLDVSMTLEDDAFETAETSSNSSHTKPRRLMSSPSFMKTALGSRSKRISFSGSIGKKHSLSLDESMMKPIDRKYDRKMGSLSELGSGNGTGDEQNGAQTTNGHVDESDESRSSSATPTTSWNKKEKKSNGLKKMVRKFF